MKCILKIGYQRILLPDTKGIEKIVDAISKGVGCGYYSPYDKSIEIDEIMDIGFELVPDSVQIKVKEGLEEQFKKYRQTAKPKALGRVLRLEHK